MPPQIGRVQNQTVYFRVLSQNGICGNYYYAHKNRNIGSYPLQNSYVVIFQYFTFLPIAIISLKNSCLNSVYFL
jgi:hypothetical protein